MKVSFTDTTRKSKYLERCIGKTVRLKDDNGNEIEVEVIAAAHSHKYPTLAEINGSYFIDYFDLFKQVDGDEDITEEDWQQLKIAFEELSADQQRAILGYDNKLNKFLKK